MERQNSAWSDNGDSTTDGKNDDDIEKNKREQRRERQDDGRNGTGERLETYRMNRTDTTGKTIEKQQQR